MAENEAERAAGMAEMAAWYRTLGKALVDPGTPFTGGVKTVSQAGVERRTDRLAGHRIQHR